MDLIYRLSVARRDISRNQVESSIYDDDLYYFLSKEEAETKIRLLEGSIDIFNFIIEACPLGRNVRKNVLKRWVYDGNGQFVSETLCSELRDSRTGEPDDFFRGRKPSQCRFKPGDIVEVRRDNDVSIEIVYMQPPTPEDIRSYHATGRPDPVTGVRGDDVYITLADRIDENAYSLYMDVHDCVYATDVMPPQRGVNDKVRKRLKEVFKAVKFEIEVIHFDETLLPPSITGLKMGISIRSKQSLKEPAVIIDLGGNSALTLSVETEPVVLCGLKNQISDDDYSSIKEWIVLNQTMVREYWEEKIYTDDLFKRQRKV